MAAVSQNGWPVNPPRTYRTVPGTDVKVTVADGPAGDVLMYVLARFDNRVEDLDLDSVRGAPDDWGWADRPIRGSEETSNHASATAVDGNATRHPLGVRGTFTRAQVREIHAILDEVDHVVRWGGDYTGRPDEMHFEINAGYADVERVARKIAGRETPPTRPKRPGRRPTLKRGSRGDAVELVQRYLGTDDDGIFGPITAREVRRYQRQQGLHVDGIVGPKTWARIEAGLRGEKPSQVDRPTLKRGSRGDAVVALQQHMNEVYPAYSQLRIDGVYGRKAQRVMREFQRRSGLVPDGIVGPKTWAELGIYGGQDG